MLEPLLPARQRDDLRLRRPRSRLLEYLTDVDAILRPYGARPHWGKLHFNRREDMPALYPRYEAFQAIRRRLDPEGRFLNDHLRGLFG